MPTKSTLSKLSKAQARVVIAKDAIATVLAHQNARAGTYLRVKDQEETVPALTQGTVCDILDKGCEGCAMGQLLLAQVRLFNKIEVPFFGDTTYQWVEIEHLSKGLQNYFTPKQLALIESAFEQSYMEGGGSYYGGSIQFDREQRRAVDFGYRFDDENERFIAIARNIVRNKGTFVPPLTKEERNEARRKARKRGL